MMLVRQTYPAITLLSALLILSCDIAGNTDRSNIGGAIAGMVTRDVNKNGDALPAGNTSIPDTSIPNTTTPTTTSTTTPPGSSDASSGLDKDGVLDANGIKKLGDVIGETIDATNKKILWAVCDEASEASIGNISLSGPSGTKVRLFGEICPKNSSTTASTKQTVLIINDYSCGMSSSGGSDPIVNGRCGRLDTARLIANELARRVTAGANIQVGLIGFASKETSATLSIPLGGVSQFQNALNAQNFCSDDTLTGSNYRSAFDLAYNVLRNVDGPKTVYFITGSLPNRGDAYGLAAKEAALKSVAMLKALNALTFEAIAIRQTQANALELANFLRQFVSNPNRVWHNFDMTGLSIGLTQTSPSSSMSVDLRNAITEARLESIGVAPSGIGLSLLKQRLDKPTYWVYGTNDFILSGNPGETKQSIAKIMVESADRSARFQSTVTINFTVTN